LQALNDRAESRYIQRTSSFAPGEFCVRLIINFLAQHRCYPAIESKMNTISTTTGANQPQCYNSQLKPFNHGSAQRYTSPSNGKCKQLTIQSVNPSLTNDWNEREIRSKLPWSTRLAAWLTRTMLNPSMETFIWLFIWPAYVITLLMPSRDPACPLLQAVFDAVCRPTVGCTLAKGIFSTVTSR